MRFLAPLSFDAHSGALRIATDGPTVEFDLSLSDKHQVVLGGDRTLSVINEQTGNQSFLVILVQDGAGSHTVTWWGGIRWPNGTLPVLTTTPDRADVFSFMHDGSGTYYGFTAGKNL